VVHLDHNGCRRDPAHDCPHPGTPDTTSINSTGHLDSIFYLNTNRGLVYFRDHD
jgi:hypothetical protein